MFSLICAWTNSSVNNRDTDDLRCSLWRHCNAINCIRGKRHTSSGRSIGDIWHFGKYRETSNISGTKSQNKMFFISSCSCLCPILWSQVLSREWRCSWSNADRRCSNYIWVINNLIALEGASYIRCLTVRFDFWRLRLIQLDTRLQLSSSHHWAWCNGDKLPQNRLEHQISLKYLHHAGTVCHHDITISAVSFPGNIAKMALWNVWQSFLVVAILMTCDIAPYSALCKRLCLSLCRHQNRSDTKCCLNSILQNTKPLVLVNPHGLFH